MAQEKLAAPPRPLVDFSANQSKLREVSWSDVGWAALLVAVLTIIASK